MQKNFLQILLFQALMLRQTFDGTFFNREIEKFGSLSHLFLNVDDINH